VSGVKNELKSIAIKVNDLLSRYIGIHDVVFKFSWRKILPLPFIFKTTDFNSLHTQAKQIFSELKTCHEQIDDLIEKTAHKESRFAHFLSEYCIALIETVSLLKKILYQLYLKSQNSKEYGLGEYNKQCDLYKKAVNKYSNMGGRLNELYEEFNQFHSKLSKPPASVEKLLERGDKRDEMFSTISNRPQIVKILQKYKREPGEIKDIFWKLMASGAGEYVAQSVIENPKLLSKYLQMETSGVSDMEIAFKFTETLGGS
jgi:uncharacterized coiled-coil DUF342 family protein